MYEVTKHDWKLFREKLPDWQEAYMERLCSEYVMLLTSDVKGSERFWTLDKRIKEDRRKPGVILSPRKSEMMIDLLRMICDKVITVDDLADFSDGLRESIEFMLRNR